MGIHLDMSRRVQGRHSKGRRTQVCAPWGGLRGVKTVWKVSAGVCVGVGMFSTYGPDEDRLVPNGFPLLICRYYQQLFTSAVVPLSFQVNEVHVSWVLY